MKYATKLLVGTVLSFLLAFLSLYPTKVYAATEISTVKIKVDEKTFSDGNPAIKCNTSGCYIVPDSEIWDKDVDECKAGDSTRVTIRLNTVDGYAFRDNIKRNKVQVTNGECVDLYYTNIGELVVEIKYTIHGKLDSPSEVYWDENRPGWARWEPVSTKVTYTLQLCRGSHKETIATELTRTFYDLSDKLNTDYYYEHDDVYFRVKTVPKSNSAKDKSSDYVESEEFDYWDDLYVHRSSSRSGYIRPYEPVAPYKTGWEKINGGWCYYDYDGSLVKNSWRYVNGHWYHFNDYGWMETGWREIGGEWYYLNTNNNNGDMYIGWHFINGNWYYFDTVRGNMLRDVYIPSADGQMMYYIKPDGRMQTGWVYYNGEKYIDPLSGVVTRTR